MASVEKTDTHPDTLREWDSPTNQPEKEGPRADNKMNDLNGKEWIQETASVWFSKGLGVNHPHAEIERQHPAPFSYQDVMRLIRFFTKSGDNVLDPFSGVASSMKAAILTGRRGTGIELIPKWAMLGRKRLREETPNPKGAIVIIGDARIVLKRMKKDSFDYAVTSPPYWRILGKKPDHKMKQERIANGFATKYSNNRKDLANISDYPTFLKELKKILRQTFRVLKNGKYASIIVSDFRHNSTFTPYHVDVTRLMEAVGFKLKGITILYQNSKSLYPYGYPYAYVPNIHHQYILNFQKPNGDGSAVDHVPR